MRHPLSRRSALTILTATVAAMLKSTPHAQTMPSSPVLTVRPTAKLTFRLDAYSEYQFVLGQKSVVITPAELMDALEGQ